ncbi:MAG: ATP-binding protein [Bacilli bacterium]|jgi:DNA helicase HerA-like ATPase|nr:ATP-binding protein [Bacilli bacterium]
MFGKIKYISDNVAHVMNAGGSSGSQDLMNVHVIFEAPDQRILGEITEINPEFIKIRFLGEYINDRYINGVIRKPLLSSQIRIINENELKELVGTESGSSFTLGHSAIYKNYLIYPDINDFFSNHFSIFGNSGSGKSCGVARIIQNVFGNKNTLSYHANLFIFDAYGEYKNAFKSIDHYSEYYNYKFITTNPVEPEDVLLQIPVNLLKLDDWALLLQANSHSQLPIIERTLRLAKIFSQQNEESEEYKNHLIAKALLAILFSNQTTASKKNEIFTVIEVCHTNDFNFDSRIAGLGYSRSFSECFEIDSNGNFGESVLITEYILKHVNDDLEEMKEPEIYSFSVLDFSRALEFTLISEGFQNNSKVYDDAIILKVRLASILNTRVGTYFVNMGYVQSDSFVQNLVMNRGKKAQIININLEDIDDTYAKVMVKIMCRIFFDYAKSLKERASIPFHLILEEAHRYIQHDNDTFLLGYNIFDRIAKEGRKYGTILGIISQRPVEISDTVIAQVSNFLIFKMTHPKDIKYIEEMLPNISADVIAKQKTLQPGSCVGFGGAFKIPMIVKLDLPNPLPYSSNCNVSACWDMKKQENFTQTSLEPINNTSLQQEIESLS